MLFANNIQSAAHHHNSNAKFCNFSIPPELEGANLVLRHNVSTSFSIFSYHIL